MLQLLTALPALYVCNVDEDSAATGNALSALVAERAKRDDAKAVVISAKIDSEIALLDAAERKEFLENLGLEEPGLTSLIREAYAILGLQTYFTAGPKESRAWTIPVGATAPQAAGRDPHRLRKGLHPRRNHRFFRLRGAEGRSRRAGGRQTARRGQDLCGQGRRRDELPVQRLMSRADLRDLVERAERVVVFTGAGVSTESGIPDFRSPGGVWSTMKPIYFKEFVENEAMRREAWTRVFNGAAGWTGKAPNAGHFAVARLIASGKASAVITQNVDNLHQDSGVPEGKVIELHGNASYAKCLACHTRYELADLERGFVEDGEIPTCRWCGGLIKTATISFGQPMPEGPMTRAEEETLACDLFLVAGSSLVVHPAAGFPILAKENGAKLVIVNREPTPLDDIADLVLHAEIGPTLTALTSSDP